MDDSDDDIENDPDWRKTPLGKRILEERRKLNLARATLSKFHLQVVLNRCKSSYQPCYGKAAIDNKYRKYINETNK